MKSFRWFFSYMLVASLGLGLAFAVSLKLMAPARSQEAPPSGDLPAEFLKEVESTQVPTPAPPQATPTAQGGDVNPTPGASPSKIPLPPGEDTMIGDGATAPSSTPVGEAAAGLPVDGLAAPNMDAGLQDMPYDPASRRDPFKPFRVARPVDPNLKLTLEPLQRHEIEKLQVIGILWDVRVPRAMIKDPDGAVHTVIKNSKVGRNEGFVAAIREGEVVVVETMYDDGKVTKETRVMELSK